MYVISSANTAYENGVISKERLKEIVKNAEEGIEEYEEVIEGKRKLETVSERETQYEAVSGSDSGIVVQTQRQLQGLGYSSQNINGRYDEVTFNNVLYFQITNGLEAIGWLDEETVEAINKRELEIAKAKITVTTQDFVEVEKPDNWEYAKKSLNQVLLGNFTDDVTFVGTAVTVAAAFTGVDLALDVRDITADFVKWEWSWPHAGQTALDAIALVPVVGVLKHTDEVVLLVKSGDKIHAVTKQAGDVAGLVKYADDAADVGKYVDDANVVKIVTNVGNELDITPALNHSIVTKNPGYKGIPNSSIDILDSNGNITTRRWFDSNGNAYRDVDLTNHGNSATHPEWPHEHIWQYGEDGKPIGR